MERQHGFRLAVLALLLSSFCTGANAAMVSNFNSNAEGWTVTGGVSSNFAWQSTGGNPGGFISASDAGAGQWYFAAPNSWNGDWTSYLGGALQFDVKILYPTTSPYDYNISPANVVIYSGANSASWSTNFKPTGSWTSFGVQLTPGNFTISGTASFDQILSNVTGVQILGEYLSNNDSEGLDNVSLTPVPLPPAALLFGSSLIGLAGVSKRRKTLRSSR